MQYRPARPNTLPGRHIWAAKMNEIDALATALYFKTDDLLTARPDLAPWRPRVGLTLRLTDAELITLSVMQALLGFTSEARWLRYAHAHLGHLFRYLPHQPGYDKRLRRAGGRADASGDAGPGHRHHGMDR
ncbi:hypothetical protein ABIA39_001778 [Nocardia sp. GAS34]